MNTTTSQEGVTAEWTQTNKRLCEELLATLPDFQRTKKSRNQDKIEHDLINGKFQQNGATIVVSDQGFLIDGQHRLTAFLRTGSFPEVIIVRGVNTHQGYATIDSGVSRTMADTFKSKGVADYANKSSISFNLLKLDTNKFNSKIGHSNNEIYEHYILKQDRVDHWCSRHPKLNHILSRTCRGSVACYCEGFMSREKIHEFFDSVESGIGHRTAISFRKLLIANSNKTRGRMKSSELMAMSLSALQLFNKGIERSKLHMPTKFPYFYAE